MGARCGECRRDLAILDRVWSDDERDAVLCPDCAPEDSDVPLGDRLDLPIGPAERIRDDV
jgi:hypothetical protein